MSGWVAIGAVFLIGVAIWYGLKSFADRPRPAPVAVPQPGPAAHDDHDDDHHDAPQPASGGNLATNTLAVALSALALIVFVVGVFFLGGSPSSGTVSAFIGHHWLTLGVVWVIMMAVGIILGARGDYFRSLVIGVGLVLIFIGIWGAIQNAMHATAVREAAVREERQKSQAPQANSYLTFIVQPSDCDVNDPAKWMELSAKHRRTLCLKDRELVLAQVKRQFKWSDGEYRDDAPSQGLRGSRYCSITGEPVSVTYHFDTAADCSTRVPERP